jgi:hypothetical protein
MRKWHIARSLAITGMAILLLMIATIDAARAQQVTNDELFAAYCVGVLRERLEHDNKLIADLEKSPPEQNSCPANMTIDQCRNLALSLYRSLAAAAAADLERYQAYVLATDPNRSRATQDAVLLAAARGRTDNQACSLHLESVCGPQRPNKDLNSFAACMKVNAACERTLRCSEASALPF